MSYYTKEVEMLEEASKLLRGLDDEDIEAFSEDIVNNIHDLFKSLLASKGFAQYEKELKTK